ncbi:MAG: hypothetical protein IKC26_11470 [Clostridia bacterium]|nr:hypothetical protein [Clostridia bacterium]MBR2908646.1 hypothetical protein [Clostridia bacterium]
MNNVKKNLSMAKKAVKKVTRRASAKFLTAAAVSAVIPYKLEKRQNPETGDDGYDLSSLLLRISIAPKCEDSIENKTLLRVGLRPMGEVRRDLQSLEALLEKKKKPVVIEPAPLSDKDAKKLRKAEKNVKKLEHKIMKKRMKAAKKAYKAAKKV